MANRGRRRKQNHSTVVVVAILLVLVEAFIFLAGYAVGVNQATEKSEEVVADTEATQEAEPQQTQQISPEEQKVNDIIKEMTVSDMVYQMMFTTPEAITGVGTAIKAGEATKTALESYPVGGIIYFSKNLEYREQAVSLIKNTQEYSKIPLFIGVDEEGGRVARIGQNPEMGTTKIPAMKEIGATGDAMQAYEAGETLAKDLKELGFNVNFAPVADVLINSSNTEIGDRSFGSEPQAVASMVERLVEGLEENGVSSALKHFPGHGSTTVDSHTGYSESTRTMEELHAVELVPFNAGIVAGADFVMVSHMTLVNALEEKVPASVSKEIITDLLLNELNFKGVVITDSFSMGAITDKYSAGEAAVKAVEAGADMILMSPDLKSAHDAVLKAVENGEITEDRIKESVKKILMLKAEKGMLD